VNGFGALRGLREDLRYAVRFFARRPVLTASAILTLAVGIGLSAAVFTFAHGVLWQELALPDSERLVYLAEIGPPPERAHARVSPANAADWARTTRTLDGLATFSPLRVVVVDGTRAEEIACAAVSLPFFRIVPVKTVSGRLLTPEDAGATPETHSTADTRRLRPAGVVISSRLWHRQFGGRPDIVGHTVQFRTFGAVEVVGILDPEFAFPMFGGADCWFADHRRADVRTTRYLVAIGRLAPGTSVSDAQAEFDVIASRLAAAHPDVNKDRGVAVTLLREHVTRDVRIQLWFLSAAGLCLLLIVSANVLNLLLANAASRRREFATRVALGASRAQLIRQALAESLVLALAGGAAGFVIARWTVPWLVSAAPVDTPRLDEIVVGGSTATVVAGASIILGVISGFLASRGSSAAAQFSVGRKFDDPHASRFRALLIVGEVALAVLLTVSASLLVQSMRAVTELPLGFEASNVVAIGFSPDSKMRARFVRELPDAAETIPGVIAAGLGPVPLGAGQADTAVSLPENPMRFVPLGAAAVGEGYFDALGVRLLAGRFITDEDGPGAPRVAVLTESASRSLLPDGGVGRTVLHEGERVQVVGVVEDIRLTPIEFEPVPMIFVSATQRSPYQTDDLMVRTSGDPLLTVPAIRTAVQEFDPRLPITQVERLTERVNTATGPRRFTLWLVVVFSVTALGLALIGIYAVLAEWVARRIPEIGVRMALGASAASVLALVVRHGGAMIGLGLSIGLTGALSLQRVLAQFTFGIAATDPGSFLIATVSVVGAGLCACLIPAARAARIDPSIALRQP
jgi:putative ABC transport system permease protein